MHAISMRLDTPQFAKGGLASKADAVRSAGRNEDSVTVHLSPQEYDALRREWGEPSINPETGNPEYFLSGLQKWFSKNPWAQVALPVATSALGVGNFVGSGINDALGLGLSSTAQNAVGSALTGGLLGGVTGGGSGALTGALIGGASPYAMSALGLGGEGGGLLSSLFGGGSGGFNGQSGDLTRGLADMQDRGGGTMTAPGVQSKMAQTGGIFGSLGAGKILPLMMAASALGGLGGGKKQSQQGAVQSVTDPNMTRPLSDVKFTRVAGDTSTMNPSEYGQGPQRSFFTNNQLPAVTAAEGGGIRSEMAEYGSQREEWGRFNDVAERRHKELGSYDKLLRDNQWRGAVRLRDEQRRKMESGAGRDPYGRDYQYSPERFGRGFYAEGGSPLQRFATGAGTGRSDEIPALLSDGEYVMDAETVALLGDGSSKAGAQRLEEFRQNVRAHKGKALAQGKFSPDARRPEQYMKGSAR